VLENFDWKVINERLGLIFEIWRLKIEDLKFEDLIFFVTINLSKQEISNLPISCQDESLSLRNFKSQIFPNLKFFQSATNIQTIFQLHCTIKHSFLIHLSLK
jgi:hypothetical protein